MMKVMVHSEGMVSVDLGREQPTAASIKFLRDTDLFRELVAVVGEDKALQTIESGAPVLPAESHSGTSE